MFQKHSSRAALLLALTSVPSAAFAQSAPAHPEEENSGQDPTRPVTRMDFRLKYQDNPGDSEAETLTFRTDKPFQLGGGWKLNTRLDIPVMRTEVPGNKTVGLTDILVQALAIAPMKGKTTIAFGAQFHVPIGSEGFTSDTWRAAPTVAAIYQLPELSRGSFVGLLVRDDFSFAGNGPDTNVVSVEPIFNWQLPERWFITMSPEAKFNTKDNWNLFLPFDMTLGKKINPTTVVSLQGDVALIDDYQQYDWQLEFRVGLFF